MKEKKGITLIALVVTIVILLILAAVSISMLTGENGIITQAKRAKEETERASREEELRLAYSNLIGTIESDSNKEYIEEALKEMVDTLNLKGIYSIKVDVSMLMEQGAKSGELKSKTIPITLDGVTEKENKKYREEVQFTVAESGINDISVLSSKGVATIEDKALLPIDLVKSLEDGKLNENIKLMKFFGSNIPIPMYKENLYTLVADFNMNSNNLKISFDNFTTKEENYKHFAIGKEFGIAINNNNELKINIGNEKGLPYAFGPTITPVIEKDEQESLNLIDKMYYINYDTMCFILDPGETVIIDGKKINMPSNVKAEYALKDAILAKDGKIWIYNGASLELKSNFMNDNKIINLYSNEKNYFVSNADTNYQCLNDVIPELQNIKFKNIYSDRYGYFVCAIDENGKIWSKDGYLDNVFPELANVKFKNVINTKHLEECKKNNNTMQASYLKIAEATTSLLRGYGIDANGNVWDLEYGVCINNIESSIIKGIKIKDGKNTTYYNSSGYAYLIGENGKLYTIDSYREVQEIPTLFAVSEVVADLIFLDTSGNLWMPYEDEKRTESEEPKFIEIFKNTEGVKFKSWVGYGMSAMLIDENNNLYRTGMTIGKFGGES